MHELLQRLIQSARTDPRRPRRYPLKEITFPDPVPSELTPSAFNAAVLTVHHILKFKNLLLAKIVLSAIGLVPTHAQTGGDAIIDPMATGVLIDTYYKDFKANNNPELTKANAQSLFITDGMNGIRTPIYGDNAHPAHPAPGVVEASWYTPHVKAILVAKAVRPDVKVFASKRLNGKTSFPAWIKSGNTLVAARYAILLADYLQYMQAQGITVDYLGVDNERQFNEGNISPTNYKDIIDQLTALSISRGFPMPILVGPEDFGPNRSSWLETLFNNGWGNRMAIYGTHYYPAFRPIKKLEADLALIGDRPFWFTELHWPNEAGQDDLEVAENAICTLWDGVDRTMSGFMWWSYSRTGLRGNLMRAFSTPLIGSRPIYMDDIDGADISVKGRLQTRAFLNGNTITVYALNLSPKDNYKNYGFNLKTGLITSTVNYTQWKKGSPATGDVGTATLNTPSSFGLTLPARSITTISFDYNLPAQDVTAWFTIIQSNFFLNSYTGRYVQWLTLRNTGGKTLPAPISVMLETLSPNATLYSSTGVTTAVKPLGSPYITLNRGAAEVIHRDETIMIALEFLNPTRQAISYSAKILAGTGAR